jgi:aryl-alcohol dehydrogenase-like predicted oxidoreductase
VSPRPAGARRPAEGEDYALWVLGRGRVVATVERRAPLDWHGIHGLAWRVRLRLPDGEAVDGMQVGDGAVTFLDPRVRAAEEAQGSVAPGAGTAGPVPTAIPTRPLGSAGPAITTVGFGAWAVGGAWAFGWGPQDDRDSIAAIHRALDAGVGWIDTAAAYGLGHSEEVVARALEGVAARPLVFTKCGMVWHDRPDRVPRADLRPEWIRRECEDSLGRLRVEALDLLQFHWPDRNTGTPIEESWGAMADLVREGKVRHAGVSNFDRDLLERCEPILHVDSLQPPLNAIQRDAADLLPWCEANGTGVIVYSPMMSGLLTGRFTAERVERLDAGDWRRGFREFREPRLSENLALQDALRPVAERHGVSVGAVAVAWALAWPGVSGAIVGARDPGQVEGWLPAAELALTPEDLDEIAAAIERTGAGQGPARPAG